MSNEPATFNRALSRNFDGDISLRLLPFPTAILLDTFVTETPIFLHGITLSSAMKFVSQSTNGVWVVMGFQSPTLFMGGIVSILASHNVVLSSGAADAPISRSTWIRFPKMQIMPGTPISLYANGFTFLGSSTKVVAQATLRLSHPIEG